MANRHHGTKGGQGQVTFEPTVIERLESTDWPGNLRQLDNVVRRAYAMAIANRSGTRDMVIEKKDVLQALVQEVSPGKSSVLATLWQAAELFAQEAERRYRQGETLSARSCGFIPRHGVGRDHTTARYRR